MSLMTAQSRTIRSQDLAQDLGHLVRAGGAAETESTGTDPAAHSQVAQPYNDNARETGADAADETHTDGFDVSATDQDHAATKMMGASPRARRRGPLVTRWIGFAAQRREARARTNRMRDGQGDAGSVRSNH